MNRKPKGIGRA